MLYNILVLVGIYKKTGHPLSISYRLDFISFFIIFRCEKAVIL